MLCKIVLCVLALVGVSSGEADYQRWSEHVYLDEPHSFTCNDTKQEGKVLYVNIDDRLVWTRHHGGELHEISNDQHFELKRMNEVDNMEMVIKKVTGDLEGLYFCDVFNSSGGHVGRIVRGLNLGGHKYHDMIDKYRSDIIRGVVAAACVFVLIVGVCLIDNFRYLTDEQKEKRREREEERKRKRAAIKNGEMNQGLDMTEESNGKRHYRSPNGLSQSEINTHL